MVDVGEAVIVFVVDGVPVFDGVDVIDGVRVIEGVGVIDGVGVIEGVEVIDGTIVVDGVAEGVVDDEGEGAIAILRSFPVPKSHTYIIPLGVSKYKP